MTRGELTKVVAIVIVVGVAVVLVFGATGAHVAGKPRSPHPWASAAIAGAIFAVASAFAITVGSRARRRR